MLLIAWYCYSRSTLNKGHSGELPDPSTLNPLPAYADMEPDSLPLICRMNITSDKPIVDSIFGKVQTGSILSYQHPPPPPDSVVIHEDAPPFPKVPLDGYHLQPTDCTYKPTDQENLHLSSLSVTLSQSHLIEEATRCQSATPEWHSLRKERVTASHFREASHLSGTSSAEKLAERIIRDTKQTTLREKGAGNGRRCIEGLCSSKKSKCVGLSFIRMHLGYCLMGLYMTHFSDHHLVWLKLNAQM